MGGPWIPGDSYWKAPFFRGYSYSILVLERRSFNLCDCFTRGSPSNPRSTAVQMLGRDTRLSHCSMIFKAHPFKGWAWIGFDGVTCDRPNWIGDTGYIQQGPRKLSFCQFAMQVGQKRIFPCNPKWTAHWRASPHVEKSVRLETSTAPKSNTWEVGENQSEEKRRNS